MQVSAQRNLSSLLQGAVKSRLEQPRLGGQDERERLTAVIQKSVQSDGVQNLPKLIQSALQEVYGLEVSVEEATYLLLEAVLLPG